MIDKEKQHLKAFLCHASGDKAEVMRLYKRLVAEGIDAWLDKEKLLPGQDWRLEIPRAVREADVVVVCLSKKSVTKEGYIQKEIQFALDIAEEKPEGTIFLIPARLEDCVVPERLSRWQWVELFEEGGFVKLLRSLKLRAEKVGALVEPIRYENGDEDTEQRLNQLYTEGLAAFYTSDWDKARNRFQTILSEQPNHKTAARKLEEAERQKSLAMLYAQATEAYKSENWPDTIKALDELLQQSTDYKDAAQLNKIAKRQLRLIELYAEAKALHTAQKWQAVLNVFEQISAIEPAYPDPENLFSSAQKEVVELQRLEKLNDLYSQAVYEMDDGRWQEAREKLELIHKSQLGFLETERLLRKVEDEIAFVDERARRNNQINILYEQAHGFIRSGNWQKALEKIEEIRNLDEQFVDKEGIAEQANANLKLEEQENQRQNELAAMYADAVRLLKDGKYQPALEKWAEIHARDSRFPDRQRVQETAKRSLAKVTKIIPVQPPLSKRTLAIAGSSALLVTILVIGFLIWRQKPPLTSPVVDVTNIPTTSLLVDRALYDDFNDPAYDGKFNTQLWKTVTVLPNIIKQENGLLILANEPGSPEAINEAFSTRTLRANQFNFLEAKMLLSSVMRGQDGECSVEFRTHDYQDQDVNFLCGFTRLPLPFIRCEVWGRTPDTAEYYTEQIDAQYDTWYTFRIEIDPEINATFYVDGEPIGTYTPGNMGDLTGKELTARIVVSGPSQDGVEGNFDDIRMGQYK